MTGRIMAGFIVLAALLAGAGLYYTQVYAFYGAVLRQDSALVMLVAAGGAEPRALPVTDLRSIDKTSSPLGYRACFTVVPSLATLTETYALAENPVPLQGPRWFDCFDANALGDALEAGQALAFQGTHEIADGVDQIIAVMADGRGFAWRQLNEKYKD